MCAVALAECFRGDGEILANPIGTLPTIGGRLAKATFEPALVMTDGEALLVENILPVGVDAPEKVVAGYNPYRTMFDVVWSGRRHIIMGASQIDSRGNQNFAFIGDPKKPTAQLLGMRGAPGNTINDKTSYWIPNHSTRVMVDEVSVVSGVGYDRAEALGPNPSRFHEIVRVVTNLCVCDFDNPEQTMQLRSLHPGVTRRRSRRRDRLRARGAGRRADHPPADRRRAALDPRGDRPARAGREGSPESVSRS